MKKIFILTLIILFFAMGCCSKYTPGKFEYRKTECIETK